MARKRTRIGRTIAVTTAWTVSLQAKMLGTGSCQSSPAEMKPFFTVMWLVHESKYDFALTLVLGGNRGPKCCKDFVGRSTLTNYGVI
jgi:hypothetical protein